LANQTLKQYELIAVNDGSCDRSEAILQTYAERFHEFIHLDSKGAGLVPSLNMALAKASGDIIVRVDADDICHPNRLKKQEALIQTGVDVAGCLVKFFPRSELMEGFRVYEAWMNRLCSHSAIASELYVETPIAHPSLAIRRTLLEKLQGYQDKDWPEDFDLMLRAFLQGAVFGKVSSVLHFWREHSERFCRSNERYQLESFIRCRCHYLARGPLSDQRDLVLWGAGPIGKKTATYLLKEGVNFEAFIDIDPKKIGGVIQGRKVYQPDLLKKKRFFVLSCVGKRNARYLVKSELESMGYRDRLDFILAA